MSRIVVATLAGLIGLAMYVMAVVSLADVMAPMNWAVQLAYFAVAGSVWVLPVRWLMLWAARLR